MKVLDLVGTNFYKPSPELAKRFIAPFVVVNDSLDRTMLQRILECDDFDSIEIIGFDVNNDSTGLAVFYK